MDIQYSHISPLLLGCHVRHLPTDRTSLPKIHEMLILKEFVKDILSKELLVTIMQVITFIEEIAF